MPDRHPAVEIDTSLVDEMLALTPAERIARHERALDLVLALEKAGRKLHLSNLDLLRRLARSGFEHVLIGGMAGVVHGSSLVTRDIDVCAPFTESNFRRLIAGLSGLRVSHRLLPSQPPLTETAAELAAAAELSLSTDLGPLDIIPDVAGLGPWPAVLAAAHVIDLEPGLTCRVLGLDALIASKRALGRTRDLMAVEELEEIRQRLRARGDH